MKTQSNRWWSGNCIRRPECLPCWSSSERRGSGAEFLGVKCRRSSSSARALSNDSAYSVRAYNLERLTLRLLRLETTACYWIFREAMHSKESPNRMHCIQCNPHFQPCCHAKNRKHFEDKSCTRSNLSVQCCCTFSFNWKTSFLPFFITSQLLWSQLVIHPHGPCGMEKDLRSKSWLLANVGDR